MLFHVPNLHLVIGSIALPYRYRPSERGRRLSIEYIVEPLPALRLDVLRYILGGRPRV
jgi:hypothetical protein